MFRKLCLSAVLGLAVLGTAVLAGDQPTVGSARESASVASTETGRPLDQAGYYVYSVDRLTCSGYWVPDSYHWSYCSAADRAAFLQELGYVTRITLTYVPS